ncbi:L-serine ammonia-lyase, iron-sulfur-dependent subunit beta [Paenibacillus pasadenensis]|uniref:L-serine ammonia-lyase, iron-sulfur-dependent subunit beta n=1 Tax=Paenibacillus pasadenensis TaxID=217090 RepID=UPI00203AB0E2|nr:L-serine ammonia-lyase, iron-sulfur-dependent subunit beta [Paenibacillus pasadenensis]MCM3749579.1 L-serine ammonia-lyase, iron-sulfur-dependent subunit beta [Paenibacillus pasadenensis]
MRFKDVFSIIGPSMIGPSSSHTAGAARIGLAARRLLGVMPDAARVSFYGSFAATYQGHGTDTAIAGGLLGFRTDDPRLPDAIELAEEAGMELIFREGKGLFPHPNTVRLELQGAGGQRLSLLGTSIGGGNVEIVEVNGFSVKFGCACPALLVRHSDQPGVIAALTAALQQAGLNIAGLSLSRMERQGEALAVVELDGEAQQGLLRQIRGLPNVLGTDYVNLNGEEEESPFELSDAEGAK